MKTATSADISASFDTLKARPVRNLWRDAIRRLLKNRLSVIGLIVVSLFVFAAVFGPWVAPYDFLEQRMEERLQGASPQHLMGTDAVGRDIFSRIVYGARTAFIVGFTVTFISLAIGVALGSLAGFLHGQVESLIMWLTDVTMSVPGILLAMLVNTSIKRPIASWFDSMYSATGNTFYLNTMWLDFVLVFGALAFISWPGYCRLIRGQVLSVGKQLYVEAARSVGGTTRHVMLRHVIPNAIGPLVVAVTQGVGGAVVLESSLSFLGVGVQPPNASWGSMLNSSLPLWRTYPHLMFYPAVTIGVIMIAFTWLGDGLNDALNPRQTR
jgi:peptide/nickel transport system permease protein